MSGQASRQSRITEPAPARAVAFPVTAARAAPLATKSADVPIAVTTAQRGRDAFLLGLANAIRLLSKASRAARMRSQAPLARLQRVDLAP